MEYIALIFSLLFFLGALVSVFWGFNIIRLNHKAGLNKAFLFMCLALSIWSFGFAMANSSNSLDNVLFWRRFSAIGWTSIISIILHFLILVSNGKNDSKVNKNLFLLHVPALINMYIFSFSNNMAKIQYNLVKIDYGWTNIAVNNGGDYFYYLYYFTYMTLSLGVVWKWKKRMKEEIKIRQTKLIFMAIISATVLGGLIDLVANTFLDKPLPQMAPLFILIPVWAMYYPARYYELINYEKLAKEEMIVTEKEKQKIFNTIAMVFCLGGILSFALNSQFININSNIKIKDIKSFMYFITGASIYFIQKIKKKGLREGLTIIILVINIPIITLRFLEYSSITVWVFPMIIIIASLVFSKKTLLISTAVVSIITQILTWILKPQARVIVDEYDYILRIILLLSAFIVGYFVNKIYIAKIEENDFRIKFQEINAKVSSDFISINKENKDGKINKLLSEMGLFFRADRTYLFLINYEDDTMTYSHEWCNEGINPEVGTIENMPLTNFSWWIKELENNKLIYIEDTRKMPKEAIKEQEQLIRQNVKSLVSVPVEGENMIKAFIGVDSVKTYRE